MQTLDLIGPMLGAAHVYLEGTAVRRTGGICPGSVERTEYRFWATRHDLRVEDSDGLVQVRGRDATGRPAHQVSFRGEVLETGPHLGQGNHEIEQLWLPRLALIWGRPGEDWRLTEHVEAQSPDRVRIRLAPTEAGGADQEGAYVEVDPDSGRLWTIALPGDRWEMVSIREFPADEQDPAPRFVVRGGG